MKVFLIIILFLFMWFLGPIWLAIQMNWKQDFKNINTESAKLAPDPKTTKEAVIQAYSARAFDWRGIFGVHSWIAIKQPNAKAYTIYQVIGWRKFYNRPILSIHEDIPDRFWFNHKPELLIDIRGKEAELLIDKIKKAADHYPYENYVLWPGPNSNTFLAFLGREVQQLQLNMPSNAIGKDFLPWGTFFAKAPSGTGYQFSFLGIFGMTIARIEGLEFNFLGMVFGFSYHNGFGIKIPAVGKINF